jgi:hypothetical protein
MHAKGKFIKILWSDDIISPNFISNSLKYMLNDVGFVYSKTVIFTNCIDNSLRDCFKFEKTGFYSTRKFILRSIINEDVPLSPGCALFRTSDLLKYLIKDIPNDFNIDFANIAIGNDLLLFLFTAENYKSYAYINESLSYFRHHENSISLSFQKDYLKFHYLVATLFFLKTNKKYISVYIGYFYLIYAKHKNSKLLKKILATKHFNLNPALKTLYILKAVTIKLYFRIINLYKSFIFN